MRLSDTHPAQTTITDLSVGTFVLESMVYYVGGLMDEELYLLNDVENAIVQRYTNKVLRQAMITVSDVAGKWGVGGEAVAHLISLGDRPYDASFQGWWG
jgi:hypothetical protein